MGVWTQMGSRYHLNHYALSYDSSGTLNARVNIKEDVTLSPNGMTFTGPFTIDVYDPNSNALLRTRLDRSPASASLRTEGPERGRPIRRGRALPRHDFDAGSAGGCGAVRRYPVRVARCRPGAAGCRMVPDGPLAARSLTRCFPSAPAGQTGLIANPGDDFEVVKLKYADVSEIVGLLTGNQTIKPNDDFAPEEPNFGSSGNSNYFGSGSLPPSPILTASGGATASSDSLGQSVDGTIGIDRRLNAVILRGSPERVAAIKQEIAMLDVPVTSVILETQFVELSESGARNLGLDLNNGNGQIAVANVDYSHGFPGFSDSPKFGGVNASFQVALYAQIAKGEGKIVSKPRISAQSGGTAKIVTGDALPILTSIALSGVNAVQQQVEYVNVGVTLQIAPE